MKNAEDTAFDPFQDEKKVSKLLSVKFGKTMKHAGVAITITSVTDLIAFAIGKSTETIFIQFSLLSFCLLRALRHYFENIAGGGCSYFLRVLSLCQNLTVVLTMHPEN